MTNCQYALAIHLCNVYTKIRNTGAIYNQIMPKCFERESVITCIIIRQRMNSLRRQWLLHINENFEPNIYLKILGFKDEYQK